jgi:hypothetical protein
MNDPDSIETAQIGWFQVLKGYFRRAWTLRQERFFAADVSTKYSTGEQWTKELIEFSGHTANTLKERGASYTHLEKTAQTTPALAPDKQQPSNEACICIAPYVSSMIVTRSSIVLAPSPQPARKKTHKDTDNFVTV